MNQYTDDQEEQIEYALRVLIFETLKPLEATMRTLR